MAGLFSNEGDVMSNIMQRRQQANQALGSPYGKYGGIVQAGGMFADIGADAAAGGGYGAADPRMQQQKELKQIAAVVAQQFPGKTDSPDFYKALALAVQDKYPQKAQEAMQMAAAKEKQMAEAKLTSLQTQQAEVDLAKSKQPAPIKTVLTEFDNKKWLLNEQTGEVIRELGSTEKPKERKTTVTEFGGNKVLIDSNTGETIKVLGEVKSGDTSIKTQVVTTKDGVFLINKETGQEIKRLGDPFSAKALEVNLSNEPDDISKLNTATTMIGKSLGKPKETLDAINKASFYLNQLDEGNTAALPQLQRIMTRISGPDSSLSQVEIQNILGSSGFAADAINAFNRALTGNISTGKIKDLSKMFKALETSLIPDYQNKLKTQMDVIDASSLSDASKKALKEQFKIGKTIVRTGTDNKTGRKVVQYSDGTTAYAD